MWKLWGIGAFLFVGMACNSGGVTINDKKEPPPVEECGSNQERLPDGKCQDKLPVVPVKPECLVNDGSCGENKICVGLNGEMEPGASGKCESGCIVGGGNTCAPGFACEGSAGQKGFCVDRAECRVKDPSKGCESKGNGFGCVGNGGATHDGAPGTCQDLAPCRIGIRNCANTSLTCVSKTVTSETGEVGECVADTINKACVAHSNCIQGQVCDIDDTEVCIHGALGQNDTVVPALSEFGIYIKDELVVPLRSQGATQDNLNADWVGPIAAELKVRARGVGANAGLNVSTSLGLLLDTATCATDCDTANEDCEWTCTLPEDWAKAPATGIEVGVSIKAEGVVQRWTYKISSAPATPSIQAPSTVVVGEELRVCVAATTTQAPLFEINAPVLQLQQPAGTALAPQVWEKDGSLSNGQQCWTLPIPLGWNGETRLVVNARAVDSVGNVTPGTYSGALMLARESCRVPDRLATLDSVSVPLAFSDGNLVFKARLSGTGATNQRLYFFNTASCAVSGFLHTGIVQGPMVVLGDTNRIALALGNEGPVTGQRLSVVNVATQTFVEERDCVPGGGGSADNAVFEKGLSLISRAGGTWQLAAPANAEAGTVLMAYVPSAASPAERCIGSTAIGAPIALAPVNASSHGMIIAHGGNLSAWFFGTSWTRNNTTTWTDVSGVSMEGLQGIALNDSEDSERIWLSASANQRLQLWRRGQTTPESLIAPNTQNINPAAIDSQGRAYVVRQYGPPGATFELRRLSADGEVEADLFRLDEGTGNTVGSPILGQPISGNAADAEVYVVRTDGRVFAFNVNNLTRALWTIDLGFAVHNGAQPVLVPHAGGGGTLWVVGARGEVSGVRVASNGLSRTAQWPKAFRDNCNTSSALVTYTNMPSCF